MVLYYMKAITVNDIFKKTESSSLSSESQTFYYILVLLEIEDILSIKYFHSKMSLAFFFNLYFLYFFFLLGFPGKSRRIKITPTLCLHGKLLLVHVAAGAAENIQFPWKTPTASPAYINM